MTALSVLVLLVCSASRPADCSVREQLSAAPVQLCQQSSFLAGAAWAATRGLTVKRASCRPVGERGA